MHTPHPDIGEAGLADDCPGCTAAAVEPTRYLDHSNLQQLAERTLSDRFDFDGERRHARSNTEAVAMASLMTFLEKMGQLVDLCPREVEWYLRERWHVETTFGETPMERAKSSLRDRP